MLKGLEQEYALTLDTEVPYENKLLVSFADLDRALALTAFVFDAESPIVVPPIRKEPSFLASPEVKWRLALNALTTPHINISGNSSLYLKYRVGAEEAISTLSKRISGCQTIEDRMSVLLHNPHGEDGEMYLGYKHDRERIVSYLETILRNNP